jgi:hypothetical protein
MRGDQLTSYSAHLEKPSAREALSFMNTKSTSESTTSVMPGTEGLNTSDYKLYLAQTAGEFDYEQKLEEAQEALEATKLAYMEAIEFCDDVEAAQAAADKAVEAGGKVIDIQKEALELTEEGLLPYDQYEEFQTLGNNAHTVLNLAVGVSDAIHNETYSLDSGHRDVCIYDIPLSQSEPLLPSGTLAAATTDMRSPLHPDNDRFERAYAGVTSIDEARGRVSDQSTERLAAALTLQSKIDEQEKVYHVSMNPEGTRAFTIDTPDPTSELAKPSSVDVAMAVRQPVEVSNEKLAQVNETVAAKSQDSPAVRLDEPSRGHSRTA